MEPKAGPFESHTGRYDAWYDDNELVYESELRAVRELLPAGDGLEVGVGSARFAAPLGVGVGVDPAGAMLARARDRGVDCVRGVAEFLPFRDAAFDWTLNVTTICFVSDVARTFAEARRVVGAGGSAVVGFVDADSPLGRQKRGRRDESPFYRDAVFRDVDEIVDAMAEAGFAEFEFRQTLFEPSANHSAPEEPRPGYGDGSFVVVRGTVEA